MSSALEADAAHEATVWGILGRQFATPKLLPANTRLDGQTAVVSGSNGGCGLEACRQLLKLGLSHLIMAVRSKARGDTAAEQLRQQLLDSSTVTISVWSLDMGSYDSVQQFVDRCATLPRIDIVILNAAAVMSTFTAHPVTGHEYTMQVNYLSACLLGILLLPVLRSSNKRNEPARPPVLSFVGSDMTYVMDNNPDSTKGPILPQYDTSEAFGLFPSYSASKLCLTLFVSRLAESLDPADVLVNICNPGITRRSNLDSYTAKTVRVGMKVMRLVLGRSVEAGSSVYLDAALARGPESHGSFISDWQIKPYPKFCYTTEGQKVKSKLWEETMEELSFANTSKILQDMQSS